MFDFKDEDISQANIMKGGAYLISTLTSGVNVDAKESWDKLHEMGLSDKECEECSKVVNQFLRHNNGNHEMCGENCVDGKIDYSHRSDDIMLIKQFKLSCIKCGTDKISGDNANPSQIKEWNMLCPDCKYPVHDSLMNAIERHFRGKMPDQEVDMFKVGFEWARIK